MKSREIRIRRLTTDLAKKDDEIRKLRGQLGTMNEMQAEQEKELADRYMALRYSERDS